MTPDEIVIGGVYLGRAGRERRMEVRKVTAIDASGRVTWRFDDEGGGQCSREKFAKWARSRLR